MLVLFCLLGFLAQSRLCSHIFSCEVKPTTYELKTVLFYRKIKIKILFSRKILVYCVLCAKAKRAHHCSNSVPKLKCKRKQNYDNSFCNLKGAQSVL